MASFSVGRVISSPVFGTLSEQYGHRWILIVCALIIALGCLQYCYAASLESIIVGQFITGIGAGSLGVTRSYVVQCATEKSQRTIYLAHLNAVQYLGSTALHPHSMISTLSHILPYIPTLCCGSLSFTLILFFAVVRCHSPLFVSSFVHPYTPLHRLWFTHNRFYSDAHLWLCDDDHRTTLSRAHSRNTFGRQSIHIASTFHGQSHLHFPPTLSSQPTLSHTL